MLLFLVGVLSILGQVVLLRELGVAFYGVELVYLLALGAWLASGAGGAMLGRRRPVATPGGRAALAALFAAGGTILFAEIVFIRGSRLLLGGVPGSFLTLTQQVLVIAAGVGPAGILMGLLFQRAARRAVAGDRTLAWAYAVESVGGLVGGLVSAAGLAWGIPNLVLGAAGAAIALGAAGIASQERIATTPGSIAVCLAPVLAGTVLVAAAPAIDVHTTRWNHQGLVTSRDTAYGRITVTRAGAQFSVFENDSLAFETEDVETESLVHFAALAHPAPRRVLLLGGTTQAVASKVLEHHPDHVDLIEPNRVLLTSIVRELPGPARAALEGDRVRIEVEDPRRFVGRAGPSYDLIVSAMPEPTSGEANRFYTREFFAEAAARLAPGGILAFRLQAAENYWTPAVLRRTRSIHLALASAFPEVMALPGARLVFLASNGELERDTGVLARRFAERGVQARLVRPAYIAYTYSNDRFAETAARLAAARAPVNSDDRPICYEYSSLIWLSAFVPALAAFDPGEDLRLRPDVWAVLLVLLGLGLLLARRARGARHAVLVGGAGAVGMILETALLLHYQLENGVIYRDLGLLLTAFMAGLAAGAWGADRWRTARPGPFGRATGLALVLTTGALALTAWASMERAGVTSLPATCALLGLAGTLVSAVFAYASLQDGNAQDRVVAPLYAADLLGGAAGSIVSTLLLIPLAGLSATAVVAGILAVAMALLL